MQSDDPTPRRDLLSADRSRTRERVRVDYQSEMGLTRSRHAAGDSKPLVGEGFAGERSIARHCKCWRSSGPRRAQGASREV